MLLPLLLAVCALPARSADLLERARASASAAGLAVPAPEPLAEPSPVAAPAAAQTPLFLRGGDFEAIDLFDTGWLDKRCTNLSPWGPSGWGVNSGTFLRADDDRALEGARFRVFSEGGSRVASLFAKESRGIKMGFARFIQGDAWGGTGCPGAAAIGWAKPAPLAVGGRRLALKIDVKTEEVRKFSSRWTVSGRSHAMIAFNVWLSSPHLPKRAVLDLAVVHDCNWGVGPCGPNPNEDGKAYHYIVHVGDGRDSPQGRWVRWIVDLNKHLRDAAARFGWPEAALRSLSITQVEFLIEVMDAQAGVVFDNVHLLEVPAGMRFGDAAIPLPAAPGADPLPIR